MTITDERLAEIESVTNEATAEPWNVGMDVVPFIYEVQSGLVADRVKQCDASFIIMARTAVPELLAEVKRLRETIDRMNERGLP